MESAYSILMFCFAGLLLLYALLLAKDEKLIPRDYAAKMEDKKRYARRLAGLLAIVALGPVFSGLAGLFTTPGQALLVLLVDLPLLIWLGIRLLFREE